MMLVKGLKAFTILVFTFLFLACSQTQSNLQVPEFSADAEPARLSLVHYNGAGFRSSRAAILAFAADRPDIRIDEVSQKVGEVPGLYGPVIQLKPGLAQVKLSGRFGMNPVIYSRLKFVAHPGRIYEIEVYRSSGFPRCLVFDRITDKVVAKAAMR